MCVCVTSERTGTRIVVDNDLGECHVTFGVPKDPAKETTELSKGASCFVIHATWQFSRSQFRIGDDFC